MHKIAILKVNITDCYYDHDCYKDDKVVDSVTEWTEVTEEEYNALRRFLPSRRRDLLLIERLNETETKETIKDMLEAAIEYEKQIKKHEEQQAKDRAALAEKRKAKQIEKARKLLAEAEKGKG